MSEKEDVDNQSESKQLDDEALEKLAVEELMREAVQGAARADVIGPSGWVRKKTQPTTNKRFLVNTIRHAVASNQRKSFKTRTRHSGTRSPKRERNFDETPQRARSKRK